VKKIDFKVCLKRDLGGVYIVTEIGRTNMENNQLNTNRERKSVKFKQEQGKSHA